MNRITNEDLDAAFNRVVMQRKRLNLDIRGIHLRYGSATYGEQYVLAVTVNKSGGISVIGRLGLTKRDAWNALNTMGDTLREV